MVAAAAGSTPRDSDADAAKRAAVATWRALDREAAAGGASTPQGTAWAERVTEAALAMVDAGAASAALDAVAALAARTREPLPRRAAARLAAALGERARPADVAAAIGALPLHGGVHWGSAIKAAARRRSPAAVKMLLSAAGADARLPSSPGTQARILLEGVAAFGVLRRPGAAVRLYEDGVAEGVWTRADVLPLNTALNAAAWGPLPRALALADAAVAAGGTLDLVSRNTLLKAAMRSARRDPARAVATAERVLASLRSARSPGDEYTYNSAVKVLSYAGDAGRALRVLDDMAAVGATPTRAVWGSLLVAAGRGGLPDAARRLWTDMVAASPSDTVPSLDVWHARLVADAFGLASGDAAAALQELTATGVMPTPLTYNLVLKSMAPPPGRGASADTLAAGLALLQDMRRSNVPPDVVTLTVLLSFAAGARDADTAAKLFTEIVGSDGVKPDAGCYEALWSAARTPAAADVALTAFRRAVWGPRRGRPRAAGYRLLTAALMDAGRPADAARVAAGAAAAGKPLPAKDLAALTSALADTGAAGGDLAALLLPALGVAAASPTSAAAAAAAGAAAPVALASLDAPEARAALLCALARLAAGDPVPSGGSEVDLGSPERPGARAALARLLEDELRLLPAGGTQPGTGARITVPAGVLEAWVAKRRR